MMKWFKRLFLPLILLAPIAAFAQGDSTIESIQNNPSTFVHAFNPAVSDMSVTYLSEVFGSVGGVLPGSEGQFLGRMFEVLNNGLVVIAGLFLMYTIFRTIIDTAQEGEFLGRKINSAWAALRTVAGFSLLIPSKATGYSLVQVLIMWVVVQGVGLADNVWSRAIDYLAKDGGAIYVTNPVASKPLETILPVAGQVLQSQICMYRLAENMKGQNDIQKEAGGDTGTGGAVSTGGEVGYSFNKYFDRKGNLVTQTLSFGTRNPKFGKKDNAPEYLDECGAYSLGLILPTTLKAAQNGEKNDTGKGSYTESAMEYKQIALQQMAIDLAPIARVFGEAKTMDDVEKDSVDDEAVKALVTSTADYVNIVSPALATTLKYSQAKAVEKIEKSKDEGWIVAGSYYRLLADINNTVDNDLGGFIPSQSKPLSATKKDGDLSDDDLGKAAIRKVVQKDDGFVKLAREEIIDATSFDKKISDTKPIDEGRFTAIYATLGTSIAASATLLGPTGAPAALIGYISGSMLALTSEWDKNMNTTKGDPIVRIQKLGNSMINIATAAWILGTLIVFGITSVMATASSVQGLGYGVMTSMRVFTTIFMGIIIALFAMGLIMAVYVPLIPFLITTFAALGWLILVVEVMVCGPLIAINITHPEGHDLLGKSEQAIMLLLNIFLRPVLILLGLFVGMILSRVGIQIINFGFSTVVNSIAVSNANFLYTLGLMMAYTLLIVYFVQFIFERSMGIHVAVSEWIGVRARPDESGQMLETFKGGAQSAGKTFGEGAQGATDSILKGEYKPEESGAKAKGTPPPGGGNQGNPGNVA